VTVVDASALLAFLQDQTGSDLVEQHLVDGAVCGAANWSEIAQKVRAAGRDWDLVRSLLLSYSLTIEPVDASDAERAARLWHRGSGLSLADRLCLALGERLDVQVLTADRSWGSDGRIRQIRG
jgi:PIN domain nuclease of toxin-antitoxin system